MNTANKIKLHSLSVCCYSVQDYTFHESDHELNGFHQLALKAIVVLGILCLLFIAYFFHDDILIAINSINLVCRYVYVTIRLETCLASSSRNDAHFIAC